MDIRKLRDYSLNSQHPVGKHKARVFKAALGLTVQDADWLRKRALEIAVIGKAAPGSPSSFGDTYVTDAWIKYKGRTALVRFSWIINFGTDFPRLTSCYIK